MRSLRSAIKGGTLPKLGVNGFLPAILQSFTFFYKTNHTTVIIVHAPLSFRAQRNEVEEPLEFERPGPTGPPGKSNAQPGQLAALQPKISHTRAAPSVRNDSRGSATPSVRNDNRESAAPSVRNDSGGGSEFGNKERVWHSRDQGAERERARPRLAAKRPSLQPDISCDHSSPQSGRTHSPDTSATKARSASEASAKRAQRKACQRKSHDQGAERKARLRLAAKRPSLHPDTSRDQGAERKARYAPNGERDRRGFQRGNGREIPFPSCPL
jgi:hypothetical protein